MKSPGGPGRVSPSGPEHTRVQTGAPDPSVCSQAFPLATLPRKQPTVLVVCGPEKNGAIGLVCARHLRVFVSTPLAPRLGLSSAPWRSGPFLCPALSPVAPTPVKGARSAWLEPGPDFGRRQGAAQGRAGEGRWVGGAHALHPPSHLQEYEPTIFYPKRSPTPEYQDFTTQCEKMDIPFLSYLPTEVSGAMAEGWAQLTPLPPPRGDRPRPDSHVQPQEPGPGRGSAGLGCFAGQGFQAQASASKRGRGSGQAVLCLQTVPLLEAKLPWARAGGAGGYIWARGVKADGFFPGIGSEQQDSKQSKPSASSARPCKRHYRGCHPAGPGHPLLSFRWKPWPSSEECDLSSLSRPAPAHRSSWPGLEKPFVPRAQRRSEPWHRAPRRLCEAEIKRRAASNEPGGAGRRARDRRASRADPCRPPLLQPLPGVAWARAASAAAPRGRRRLLLQGLPPAGARALASGRWKTTPAGRDGSLCSLPVAGQPCMSYNHALSSHRLPLCPLCRGATGMRASLLLPAHCLRLPAGGW